MQIVECCAELGSDSLIYVVLDRLVGKNSPLDSYRADDKIMSKDVAPKFFGRIPFARSRRTPHTESGALKREVKSLEELSGEVGII